MPIWNPTRSLQILKKVVPLFLKAKEANGKAFDFKKWINQVDNDGKKVWCTVFEENGIDKHITNFDKLYVKDMRKIGLVLAPHTVDFNDTNFTPCDIRMTCAGHVTSDQSRRYCGHGENLGPDYIANLPKYVKLVNHCIMTNLKPPKIVNVELVNLPEAEEVNDNMQIDGTVVNTEGSVKRKHIEENEIPGFAPRQELAPPELKRSCGEGVHYHHDGPRHDFEFYM